MKNNKNYINITINSSQFELNCRFGSHPRLQYFWKSNLYFFFNIFKNECIFFFFFKFFFKNKKLKIIFFLLKKYKLAFGDASTNDTLIEDGIEAINNTHSRLIQMADVNNQIRKLRILSR